MPSIFKTKRWIWFLGLLAVSCCPSCVNTFTVPRAMVIGHYVYDCNSPFSKCDTEELTLNEDGTFVQRLLTAWEPAARNL